MGCAIEAAQLTERKSERASSASTKATASKTRSAKARQKQSPDESAPSQSRLIAIDELHRDRLKKGRRRIFILASLGKAVHSRRDSLSRGPWPRNLHEKLLPKPNPPPRRRPRQKRLPRRKSSRPSPDAGRREPTRPVVRFGLLLALSGRRSNRRPLVPTKPRIAGGPATALHPGRERG